MFMKVTSFAFAFILTFCCGHLCSAPWNQAGGPNGNWQITSETTAPSTWSVSQNQNIESRTTLPEGGQSGIAIWEDHLFLTILKPIQSSTTNKVDRKLLKGSFIVALCSNTNSGKIKWERAITGSVDSQFLSGFSDSTTPTPVTDGTHVWFTNASGNITCFDFEGKKIWERTWTPVTALNAAHFPFNKQHESIRISTSPSWEAFHTRSNREPPPSTKPL
jgi:hypothetical protein